MKQREWFGLYAESWGDDLHPDAFAHPAKVQPALARRIYEHAIRQGYVKPGDTVIDPFAGVGGFARHAMQYGLHFVGVELEEKFVELAAKNIGLWQRHGRWFDGWGTAVVLQGDSRKLANVMEAGAVISSPPYASGEKGHPSLGSVNKDEWGTDGRDIAGRRGLNGHYGKTTGQLADLPEGDVDAAISSPPYGSAVDGTGEGPGARFDFVHHAPDNATKPSSANGYGRSDGQLGRLDAAISSPPWMGQTPGAEGAGFEKRPDGSDFGAGKSMQSDYTEKIEYEKRGFLMGKEGYEKWAASCNLGQITTSQGTFWTAARAIVEQVYTVLRPGGVALWVTGNFVRGGEVVDFGGQWLQLCEACGFEPLEHITAWKIEPGPTQLGLLGDDKDMTVERLSFFRRLANKRNPDAKVESEDVWIVRKPA